MNYTVLVGKECEECISLLRYLKENELPYDVVDIHSDSTEMNLQSSIIPALFIGNKLIAYGEQDIVAAFQRIAS